MQIIVVHLVQEFEPLPESEWCLLLEREENETQYNYSQCLDAARTHELLKAMVSQKDRQAQESAREVARAEKVRQDAELAEHYSEQPRPLASSPQDLDPSRLTFSALLYLFSSSYSINYCC